MESVALIRTKLYRPRLADDLVERPRLRAQLDRGLERKLTLVAAPAGYGKSTLVAGWLETCARPNAWLSLDENDSDLMVFLNSFIAAVQSIFPEACRESSALLRSPERTPPFVLTTTLINDLDRIEQPYILVLDDYHLIHDLAVHNLMDDLLHYAPRTLHLVLISRLNPPLNLLRLRAQGQLTEIRADELRFTTDEVLAFMQRVRGATANVTVAAKLQEKTEGWAAGLRLCFLSMQGPDELDAVAERLPGQGLATNYLFHEVFTSQPLEIQAYLLETSILDRFSADLCEHLHRVESEPGHRSGRAFIDRLVRAGVFVIPVDDEQKWFRYHHLFQEALQRQLSKMYGEERIVQLHELASQWFARNGLIEDAVRHALAAGSPVRAAELIEQHKDEVLNPSRWQVLERWLAHLPEEIIRQRPQLLLARLWILHFLYDISAMPPLLKRVDDLLEGEEDDPVTAGEGAFFRGESLFWAGRIEQSISYFERALTLLTPERKLARSAASTFLVMAYQVAGEFSRAVVTGRALLAENPEDGAHKGRALGSLVCIHLLAGRAMEGGRFASRLMAMAERTDDPFFLGWAAYLLGCIHFGWNELETAIGYFTLAVDKRFFLNQNLPIDSYIGLAISYQALGRDEQVDEIMERFLKYTQIRPNPMSALLIQSLQARLAILRGDREKMGRLLRTVDFSADRGTIFVAVESPRITHGRLLVAWGTDAALQKAVPLLQGHLQWTRNTHNVRHQIEILPILAVAYQKQGRFRKAVQTLEEALMLAEPGGWVRPFLDLGSEMGELLQKVEGDGSLRDFRDQLLKSLPKPQASQALQRLAQLPEPLTNRELDVLALLVQRRTNKEIAQTLGISPVTVKRHTSNIYQKLLVNGRHQAAEKAVSLGIVHPLK